jgi:transposase
VLVGFEATGNYHRPLTYFLHRQGFELRLIPTLALARTREAMHNSWDLAEAGDLRRFRHHRQFLSFCGLNLSTLQSGKSRGQSHISKYGNARLRTALWMAAQTPSFFRARCISWASCFNVAASDRTRNHSGECYGGRNDEHLSLHSP